MFLKLLLCALFGTVAVQAASISLEKKNESPIVIVSTKEAFYLRRLNGTILFSGESSKDQLFLLPNFPVIRRIKRASRKTNKGYNGQNSSGSGTGRNVNRGGARVGLNTASNTGINGGHFGNILSNSNAFNQRYSPTLPQRSSQNWLENKIRLYHYTDKKGFEGIKNANKIIPSTIKGGDARYGDGVYLTALGPENGQGIINKNNWLKNNPNNPKTKYCFGFDICPSEVKKITDGRDIYLYPKELTLPPNPYFWKANDKKRGSGV